MKNAADKSKKNNKMLIAGGVILVAAVALLAVLYTQFWAPKGQVGSKTITVEVVYEDKTSKEYEIKTDEEFLRKALESKKLVAGNESEMGLFVTTVDNVKIDETKQQWWCFTKSKETVNTSVDQTPIADKDHFEITFTTGW